MAKGSAIKKRHLKKRINEKVCLTNQVRERESQRNIPRLKKARGNWRGAGKEVVAPKKLILGRIIKRGSQFEEIKMPRENHSKEEP